MELHIYKGFAFPTDHFFSGKCVLFAGTLERCSRRDAWTDSFLIAAESLLTVTRYG